MGRTLDRLIDGYSFLECPRWHDNRLYLSDFYTEQVIAVTLGGQVDKVVDVAAQPSGLGWMPDGTLLIASMRDRKVVAFNGTSLTTHADLSRLALSHLNDMVIDAQGRAYVGNFGSDILVGEPLRSADLVRVDPDGSATIVAQDMHFANGAVITPDGKTLIISETFANRVSAFDIETDGSLSNRRAFWAHSPPPETDDLATALDSGQVAVMPDGMTLDAEGAIWVADAIGNRALRIKDGVVVEQIHTGDLELGVFACALGGEDDKTLFLAAAPTFHAEQCKANYKACVLTTQVEVPHAGLP